jgi:hypothetical protein
MRMDIKSKILKNELTREIVSIRTDTLWKMLKLKAAGFLPSPFEEGATGKFDNKGAIFIPGGLIYQDVDERPINYEVHNELTVKAFHECIGYSMQFDNATLLYPNGMAPSVHLDSGFFSKAARRIYTLKKAAFRRKSKIGSPKHLKIDSDEIVRSHCPTYMAQPYGARTRISTCAALGLMDTPLYFAYCETQFNLTPAQAGKFADQLDTALDPGKNDDNKVLYPPYIMVCHDTRYSEKSLVGLTRILGIGKFGEFATFTFEELTPSFSALLKRRKVQFSKEDCFATYNDSHVLGVLRIYAPANPGKRSQKHAIHIVSPVNDLDLDLSKIEEQARERYQIT